MTCRTARDSVFYRIVVNFFYIDVKPRTIDEVNVFEAVARGAIRPAPARGMFFLGECEPAGSVENISVILASVKLGAAAGKDREHEAD